MTVNVYDPSGGSAGRSVGEMLNSLAPHNILTFEESVLTHPTHADGLVDKGDPVIVGENLVGVALKSAEANTDLISIDVGGIWMLNVYGAIADGTDDGGASALQPGAPIYINKTTCVLSGIMSDGNWLPFGVTLTTVASGATTLTLASVKIQNAFNVLQMGNIPEFAPSGASAPGLRSGSAGGDSSRSIAILVNGVLKYITVYDDIET